MPAQQHVCLVCGYNMIGECPDRCPFCGAGREHFLTAETCSARFRVRSTPVTDRVLRLNSVPALGIEHAAYRVETATQAFWIDCPASFDRRLVPVDVITFTHRDFLGASNQYREHFGAEVWIHRLDADDPLSRPFPFDRLFDQAFEAEGIEVHPIGGHTPGFTVYLFEEVLFVCDLVFPADGQMRFNPYGPQDRTRRAGEQLYALLKGRSLRKVCGWNYVADCADWRAQFDRLLARD